MEVAVAKESGAALMTDRPRSMIVPRWLPENDENLLLLREVDFSYCMDTLKKINQKHTIL